MKMEEFNLHFHSLEGITIGEKRKSLFLLLSKAKQQSLDINFDILQTTTLLEEKFKVDALIYFKRIPELVEILKSENTILITRILKKNKWFINEIFSNITAEQLTNLFPHISFNLKLKILNKISTKLGYSQQSEAFFETIEDKYGSNLSSKLLSNCRPDFILNFLSNSKFKLTPKQLLSIIKNNPKITEDIIEILLEKHSNIGFEYDYVLSYVAQWNLVLFLKLYKKCNWCLKLGRRLTQKFIKINKQNVINNPDEFYRYLHNKQIAKSTGHDFQQLFCNLFPAKLENFEKLSYKIYSILDGLPAKMKSSHLITTSFEKVYGVPIWDYPEYVKLELLQMLTSDERESVLKIEFKPSNITDDKWMCYRKTKNSIPYLKNRISLTSNINIRAKLVELLVETCKINSDLKALADVCNYVVTKHRNDNYKVRNAFLTKLSQDFNLINLDTNHWNCINTLLELFTLNNEIFEQITFLEEYIHFRFSNNLPINDQLNLWISLKYKRLNIVTNKPECEKQCLLLFPKIIAESFHNQDLDSWNFLYLSALIHWNKRYPKDKIPLEQFKSTMASLKQIFKHKYSTIEALVLIHCLQCPLNREEQSELINIFLNLKGYRLPILDQIIWWVKHDPRIIVENIETIAEVVAEEGYKQYFCVTFWKYCKNYSHLKIPEQLIMLYLKMFEENLNSDHYCAELKLENIIAALSCLMNVDTFIEFVTPYNPVELQVNSKSKESKVIYNLQQSIGNNLKNVIPPSSAMAIILIYCKGDYLKLIRKSLYSVSGNVNEDKLVPFFNELIDRAVSVRKHAMHLTFRVLDKIQVYNVLNYFMQSEQNASIRKFIFKGCFDFFVKNPTNYTWELVKLNLNAVDINDTEAVDVLMQIDKIPSQYVVEYIIFAWEILHKIPDPDGKQKSNEGNLLNSISNDIIPLLPKEFCESIIREYFYTWNPIEYLTCTQSSIIKFVCKYIIYCGSKFEQEERLITKFEILKNFITNSWNKRETRTTSRNSSIDFLKEFCLSFLTNQSSDKEILTKFTELWNNFIKPHESINEYLHLQFTLIFIEKLSIQEVSTKLAEFCDSLCDTYGNVVIGMFFNKLIFFTRYFFKNGSTEENYYILIEHFLNRNSLACCLLVILLINKYKLNASNTIDKYYEIIKFLESKQNQLIQLYLYNHLSGSAKLHYTNT